MNRILYDPDLGRLIVGFVQMIGGAFIVIYALIVGFRR